MSREHVPAGSRQRGFTLIELMIAMVVGLLVVAAAMSLFLSTSRTHRSVDQVATLMDSARAAVSMIERDLKLAGYWGFVSSAHLIQARAGVTGAINPAVANDCASGTSFTVDLDRIVEVHDNVELADCLVNYLAGTDVLAIRRAATGTPATVLDANALYVKSDHLYGQVFQGNTPPTGTFGTPNETRALQVLVYYVSTNSDAPGAGSSLRRRRLASGPALVDEELVPGVEDLQIELGIDTDDDGSVDTYVSPTVAGAAADAAIAVRISVLVHATANDISYTDTGDYLSLGTAQKRINSLDRRRMQFSKTVMLRN